MGCMAAAVIRGYVAGMASPQALDAGSGRPKINADLLDVADQLHREFANRLTSCEVNECLYQVAAKFEDANVRSFVPLLVRRYVRDELQARLAHAQTYQGAAQES